MVRFPFLSKSKKTAAAWPCVAAPSTPSFRRDSSSETLSDSSDSSSSDSAVARGLRSDRLIFQPGETNSLMKSTRSPADDDAAAAALVAVDSADPYLDFRASMEEMMEAHGLRDWDSLEKLLAVYLRVNRRCNHGYIVGAFVDLLLHLGTPDKMNTPNNRSTGKEECSSSTATATASLTSPLSFSSSTRSSVSPCSRLYKM